MPLTLVTGPANSAKAGEVLGGLRDRLDDEPILVVPAFQDVEHAQRELAARGAVFGAEILRFDRLFQKLAERAGYGERIASRFQRELIVEEAVRSAKLEVLAESAAQPGFPRAAARFVAELERSMVDPARFTSALRQWAGDGPRRAYADEIASIYRRYRGGLEQAGLADRELFAWRALDALAAEPQRWGTTPVFVYGFDDFTKLELDALETLAKSCGAEVTVSLPYEPGRFAFKAVAGTYERLSAIATSRIELEPVSDHYADDSRDALHGIERGLFEAEAPRDLKAGPAVRLHSAGGERAEIELAAAHILRLLRNEDMQAGDVAVVLRDPSRYASLIEQVFGAYGIPYSIDRAVKLAHTGLGRGLLALVRCAVLDGGSEDLLAWLRAPGKLDQPALADRLEAEARREGATGAVAVRKLWERERWPLEELDRLTSARTTADFVAELDHQLQRVFAAPYRRKAPILDDAQLDDAKAFNAAHRALRDLHKVLSSNPDTELDRQRVHDTLAELQVHLGENPQPDRVQVADPGAIRARRFDAVFACGLQEGEFPGGSTPEPFLPDDDRRRIAEASGLMLPLRENRLDRERYLFYVTASRAERLLVLSSRYCDEEGNPQSPSFFVDDVRDLFEELPEVRRSLSEVTWKLDEAPTADEFDRALALQGPRHEESAPEALSAAPLLELLAERGAVSASAIEHFADCPVKWLVEDLLRPLELEPDPEPMVRGSYAHAVLERTYARLREETGSRRVTRENLVEAERIALDELRMAREEFRISPKTTRMRAAVRRLEFDLLRFLHHEAEADGSFEPEHLELSFGIDGSEPVEIAQGVSVRGKIDRVDVWEGHALVRDYKSGKSADSYKVASWEPKNRFQAALYMLVVERLLGLKPAGGVYVPLGGSERRPRGMVSAELPELGGDFYDNDRLDAEAFEERIEWARDRIVDTAGRMRRGELCSSPDTCAWNGGCSYPSICRTEA